VSLADVAIIGAGPAGLIAADALSAQGFAVTVYERMPSPARKFLMAGRGGLNITHSEELRAFLRRYGPAAPWLEPAIAAFPPSAMRAFCAALGEDTFVGSSGRVFPKSHKASPLLRAWLAKLEAQGVRLLTRATWLGWDAQGRLIFDDAAPVRPVATLLAMGGASWPRLGSNGAWTGLLTARGVSLTPWQSANCGVDIAWPEAVHQRFAGTPLKNIALSLGPHRVRGEAVISAYGLEGGAVYALGAPIRSALASADTLTLMLDLKPDLSEAALAARLAKAPPGQSLANRLRRAGLPPVAAALLRMAPAGTSAKAIPLPITRLQGLERAISSAGGVCLEALDEHLMLRALPGVFAAGEMLDWDAPTGGYLLQACFATGLAAARGVAAWITASPKTAPSPR
jgi:uncharacterized flavoprotein (TIGR03862 family)